MLYLLWVATGNVFAGTSYAGVSIQKQHFIVYKLRV